MQIGSLSLLPGACLAPMAGVADRAFRELCASFGASYVVSEMVSAKGIYYGDKKSLELMTLGRAERPAGIQLFGTEPDVMAYAAKQALQFTPDVLDINMGCPAPKITSGGAGSALMKTPELCGEIVAAVKRVSPVPVTVKLRKGWDWTNPNVVQVARICEQAGADTVFVHGRTREQMYAPPVDLDSIRAVKQALSIPVIGNGGITCVQDAVHMLRYTGCDLVMVGQGVLGNPWIFSDIRHFLQTGSVPEPPSLEEKMRVMKEHIRLACTYKGEVIGMKEARKHIAWYVKGLKGAAALRRQAVELSSFAQLDGFIATVLHIQQHGEETEPAK